VKICLFGFIGCDGVLYTKIQVVLVVTPK